MNSSVYRLRLDIHNPTSQDLINMNKGETARRIEIEFYENNTSYELGDNVTAVICISDDTALYPVKIVGNKVFYEPLAELTGTVGVKDVQVRLMQSMNDTVNPENAETDRLIYSPRFSVAVHDVVNEGSTVDEQAKQGDLIAQINEVIRKADNGEFNGQGGKDGIDGADGYSPEVTVTPSEQPPGHYVTITDAEHPDGQEFFVADGQGDRKVFVLNWSDGKDSAGVEHPTEAEKQTIVDTIAEINTMEVGTYEVLLNVSNRYLPLITYVPSYCLVFRDDWSSEEPMRYEIYAPSVESYSQEALRYVEDYKYDTTITGFRPATMYLTAQYIKEQISVKEDSANKVTSLSAESTDKQYPSAKAVYNLVGHVDDKINELGKVYVDSEQPTDFTEKDIWVDTSDNQTPVVSAGSTSVVLGGEVYDAIQEALGSIETALEALTTGGGVE